MFILTDRRIPAAVKSHLKKYGELLFVESNDIVYPAISGHPDIFVCQTKNGLFIAPNTPGKLKDQLREKHIRFVEGKATIGQKYPQTAPYNAVVTNQLLIHNLQLSDAVLLDECASLKRIHVNQGYSRCNIIALDDKRFITSDRGIEKALANKGFDVLFVSPKGIILPGFNHGFIGGCCGVFENTLFFTGSLNHFPEGDKIRNFVKGKEVIELYDGPLFDGGSLMFID